MSSQQTESYTAIVCPACGDRVGDCWEWVRDYRVTHRCENEDCGVTYEVWAEYDVTYHAKLLVTGTA